jgi:hypothetical protein
VNHHEQPAGPTCDQATGPAGTNPDLPDFAADPSDVPALLSWMTALCADLGIDVVKVAPDAPDWSEKGDRFWSTPEQDARPCAAVWFASVDDVIRFQEAPVGVRFEFGCDWGNYGVLGLRGALLQVASLFRLRSQRGVYGKAIPHEDLAELVAGLAHAHRAARGGETP